MLRVRRWLKSRSGNVAIITALVLPSLVGFCGLGAEAGYWYYRQRTMQAAADLAAIDGDQTLRYGGSSGAVTTSATTAATNNDWSSATGTITVNTPPTSGTHQDNQSVEVLLTENVSRYFSAVLMGNGTVPISARSVATFTPQGPACFLGLDHTKSKTVDFWGNATADFTSCNIISDSNAPDSFTVGGSANVTVPCVSAVGGSSVTATLTLTQCGTVNTNQPAAADPYASVPDPTIPPGCSNLGNGETPQPDHCYNGDSVNFKDTMNLAPGTYYFSGGSVQSTSTANVTGNGVTFVFTNNATFQFNGSSQWNLTAPTSGTYAGIVMWGDRNNDWQTNTLNGNDNSVFTGALYFPKEEVRFLGNFSGANGCMQLVADNIYYTGNGVFSTNCAGTGVHTIQTPGGPVALAE
jgi:Flp pilus assembly protein TadG